MHPTLDLLISGFREAQDLGVMTIVQDLKIPRPRAAIDWVSICSSRGLRKVRELNGIGIRVHGFGVELKIGKVTVDFDWGDHGEPDGFDGWRLWSFALDNLPNTQCSHDVINEWIDIAVADAELIKVGSLYYDPTRRAISV